MKNCSRCGELKPIEEFQKNRRLPDGHTGICKVCRKNYLNEYNSKNKDAIKAKKSQRYKDNIEVEKLKRKKYYEDNKEKIKLKTREYNSLNKDKIKIRRKKYNLDNKDVLNKRKKEYWKKNPEKRKYILKKHKSKNRLKENLRNRIYCAIVRQNGWTKKGKSEDLLGCNYSQIKDYLHSKFLPGMTWDNYGFGRDKWNIDHIIPLASATNLEEMENLCHYTNLQPLWQIDNQQKRDKIL